MMALWKEDKIGEASVIRTKTKQKIKNETMTVEKLENKSTDTENKQTNV